MHTMGLDPITAGLAVQVGQNLLTGLFSPQPSGPSAAQLAALAQQQQAANTKTMLIVGGVLVAGVLGYLLIARK